METKIQVGDCIKAFDFEPCAGRPDFYVVGIVRKIGFIGPRGEFSHEFNGGYAAYVIQCVYDSDSDQREYVENAENQYSRVGHEVFVPVQTSMDYDGRVSKI